jgi:hypothetical protein
MYVQGGQFLAPVIIPIPLLDSGVRYIDQTVYFFGNTVKIVIKGVKLSQVSSYRVPKISRVGK